MAKNLASVKPVRSHSILNKDGCLSEVSDGDSMIVSCTLLTTARYKKLMDVVKAAIDYRDAGDAIDKSLITWNDYNQRVNELSAAIEAAEKAGAL